MITTTPLCFLSSLALTSTARRLIQQLGVSLLLACAGFGLIPAEAADPSPVTPLPSVGVSARVPLVKIAEFKMRESRSAAAAVSDGRYLYIIGGQDSAGNVLNTIERFDPKTGASEAFAILHQSRLRHQAVLHAGKIYVLGGSREGLNRTTPEFTDLLRAPPEVRAMARINDESDPTIPTGFLDLEGSMEIVDLATRSVSQGTALPEPRNQFGCVTLGGELYVLGGQREVGSRRAFTNTVKIYSFATGRWRDGVPMPTPRGTQAVLVDGPFIVVPGGYDGAITRDTVEAFNPRENDWIILPRLCRHSSAHSVVFMGHYVFLFGNYSAPEEIIAYDLITKQSEAFTLQYKAVRDTAAVALDGKIYVIGGKKSKTTNAVDDIQVFAPPPRRLRDKD